MDLPLTLNLEQQFNLKVYQDQVRVLSREQAQEALLTLLSLKA
jgi:Phycobilisome degradation protein nblA